MLTAGLWICHQQKKPQEDCFPNASELSQWVNNSFGLGARPIPLNTPFFFFWWRSQLSPASGSPSASRTEPNHSKPPPRFGTGIRPDATPFCLPRLGKAMRKYLQLKRQPGKLLRVHLAQAVPARSPRSHLPCLGWSGTKESTPRDPRPVARVPRSVQAQNIPGVHFRSTAWTKRKLRSCYPSSPSMTQNVWLKIGFVITL